MSDDPEAQSKNYMEAAFRSMMQAAERGQVLESVAEKLKSYRVSTNDSELLQAKQLAHFCGALICYALEEPGLTSLAHCDSDRYHAIRKPLLAAFAATVGMRLWLAQTGEDAAEVSIPDFLVKEMELCTISAMGHG